MPRLNVKDRVDAMVRDVLGPEMKAAGFRRSGRVFWRNGPEVCQVAAVTMDRWGLSDKSSFDVRLGVFWHRVEAILEDSPIGRMPPAEHRCTFRIDLGRVISYPPKPSWKVTTSSDFGAMGREVMADMNRHGIPWLEYRSDLRRTLEWKGYARSVGGRNYSVQELVLPSARVVFKALLGRRAEALADLRAFSATGGEVSVNLARRVRRLSGNRTSAR